MPARAAMIITEEMLDNRTPEQYMIDNGYDDDDTDNIVEAFIGFVRCSGCDGISSQKIALRPGVNETHDPACGYWVKWPDN